MIPDNEAVVSNNINILHNNCTLVLISGPIDSARVYFYRSGFLTYSYSDCRHIKVPDFVFGGYLDEYDACTFTGKFELTLGNNVNQTISITNGGFTFHGVHR